MPALVELVVVDEIGIGLLRPTPRLLILERRPPPYHALLPATGCNPTATVSACLSRSSAGAICARLPPVATTGLHKGSILSCQRWRHDSRRRSRCSAFCVLLGCARVELEPDDGFVADDPGVVPGLDHVRLSRADLLLGSVIVDGVHCARLQ